MTGNSADAFDAREHYTKYEYSIPMRDGVKLFTSVLVPKDASTTYPFLIMRTPFGVGHYTDDATIAGGGLSWRLQWNT